MSLIFEAQTSLFTTKQKEGESLQDYTKRFHIAREVYETLIAGPIKLQKFYLETKDILNLQTTTLNMKRTIYLKQKHLNNIWHLSTYTMQIKQNMDQLWLD